MKIKPLSDRIVVKPIASDSRVGSIIIPENIRDKEKKGEVIAVGPKVQELAVGDIVIFGTHAGTELTIGKIDHRIMPESEVYAVLND